MVLREFAHYVVIYFQALVKEKRRGKFLEKPFFLLKFS